ncbi:hypothetical protein COJ96_06070 [Bacillus sp. AFS073361]|uniref:hypothetical protein n=1 Tax=Bacillus sp. AFS073361 TaxID=2033511 RepID=UPI000BF3A03D|nr:hypothetical protein [Bacillus sp. AFS073361]PFP30276.1 hypothetical protein COJ96_06070 [Bacillus sp. AFS073361]
MAFQQYIDFSVSLDSIVQGNNGSILRFTVLRNKATVSIQDATVSVAIKQGATLAVKQASITDAVSGKCEVTLNKADLTTPGLYFFQPTVTYADGDEFSGDVQRFKVTGKLTGVPPVDGGGTGDITVSIDGGDLG